MTPARLHPSDLLRVAALGLRTRRLRAALSALGIGIGVAAIVAVLGLSASSRAGLLAQIDRLGTNLLSVSAGQSFGGDPARLPRSAPAKIEGLEAVEATADIGSVSGAKVYRSPLVPSINSKGIGVAAASLDLPGVVGTKVAQGAYLNRATAGQPVTVLGSEAAKRLGIDRVYAGQRIWLDGQWFYVAGILEPAELAPELDGLALVGYPAARHYLNYATLRDGRETSGPPSTVYVRADTDAVNEVQEILAATVRPEAPSEVEVSQPSDVLTARAQTQSALDSLFLGLGAVALLVGAVGVANIMIISVLERRSEIGLRRALGATRAQIRTQFLAEAVMLALLGGLAGCAVGSLATAAYAATRGWAIVIPAEAWAGGMAAALAIGALAGLLPALRAARMSPTEALRAV